MLNETPLNRTERLEKDNDYQKLSPVLHSAIETALKCFVDETVKALNNQASLPSRRIKFTFITSMSFRVTSNRTPNSGDTIGKIDCNLGTLVHLYDFFYKMLTRSFDLQNAHLITFYMLQFSMDFLLAHEIAHIYYGHNVLKAELINSKDTNRFDYTQAMEWDADCFAATKLYEQVKIASKQNIFPDLEPKEIVIYLIGAIHGLFFLNADCDDIINVDNMEHPPMAIREALVIRVFNNLFQNRLYGDLNSYIDQYDKAIQKAFELTNQETQSFRKKYYDNLEYADSIQKRWFTYVKHLIAKHSYLPIETLHYSDYRTVVNDL